jgi:4-amino-4-deoxy-L-arabinose transferase-like glycosyltransferase
VLRSGALVIVVGWVCVVAIPEMFRDRIYPFDSAIFAASGALFLSMFGDLMTFTSSPASWLWDYYNQYPALFVRRYPPLFGVVEAGVFAMTGVSVFGAKLTVLIFSVIFSVFTYLLLLRIWRDDILAVSATLLIVTAPMISIYMRSVWLDMPALAFAMGAIYFYVRRLDTTEKTGKTLIPIVLFTILSLYTYQLTFFLLAGMVLHLLYVERQTLFKQKALWWAGALSLVMLLPLGVQSLYFAKENILAVSGMVPQGWGGFAPVENKLALTYWTYYAWMFVTQLPVAAFGLVLWILVWPRRRPSIFEGLFVACLVCAYVGFSWLPAKNPRYAMYIAIPALILAFAAIWEASRLWLPTLGKSLRYCAAGFTILVAIVQSYAVEVAPFHYYLSNMRHPVEAILTQRPEARIFYSGKNDAAFIFYIRGKDHERRARVYRASVQIERPEGVAAFIANEGIDVIVYETDTQRSGLSDYTAFRRAIETLVRTDSSFLPLGRFDLPYEGEGIAGTVTLMLYMRKQS